MVWAVGQASMGEWRGRGEVGVGTDGSWENSQGWTGMRCEWRLGGVAECRQADRAMRK